MPTELLQLSSGWCRRCLSEATTVITERGSSFGLRGSSSRAHHAVSYNTTLTSPPACNLQDGGVCVEVPIHDEAPSYLADLCIPVASTQGRQDVNSCVPRRPELLWSHVLGPLQPSAASLSMDRVHGTAYPQPYVHRTSRCAHSSAS